MWIEQNFFKYITAVILVLLTSLLLYYNLPVFYLLLWFGTAIFLPVLFSTLLYYLFRPVIHFFRHWMPRFAAIILLYTVLAVVLTLMGIFLIPEFIDVVNRFSAENLDSIKEHTNRFFSHLNGYIPINFSSLEKLFLDNLSKINEYAYSFFVSLFTAVTSITIAVALTPFILYYFLRDDMLFASFILRFIPEKHKEEIETILHDVDVTLTSFISTQAIVAFIVGTFLFIGYLIIGLPYSLSLALFGMVFYVIPFLGTFIGIIPALIVAASIEFSMMMNVVIIMMIAHLIESYLITPRLMSNTLQIHPLTIILLLLTGGSLFGVLGLVLITPTYAILKVLVWNIYKISQLKYQESKLKNFLVPGQENIIIRKEDHPTVSEL